MSEVFEPLDANERRVRGIDIDTRTVRVARQISHPRGGDHSFGSPKSKAGRRVVAFPDLVAPDLRKHLDALSADDLVSPVRKLMVSGML